MKRYICAAIRPLENEPFEVIYEYAINPRTSPDTLHRLAQSCGTLVKVGIINNPNVSMDTLALLADDDASLVRETLAMRTKTTLQILDKLAEDPVYTVRRKVAANPMTPLRILTKLAKDKEYVVRVAVARNPKASPSLLRRMAKHDATLAFKVLSNPSCPHEVAEDLLGCNSYIRSELAMHPDVPSDILSILAHDPNRDVVIGAIMNPNTPVEDIKEYINNDDYILRENAKVALAKRGVEV